MTKLEDLRIPIELTDRTNKKCVLVSDRNPMFAEMLVNELGLMAGIDCHYVPKNKDLSEVVEVLKPDVLILDPAHLPLSQEQDLIVFARKIKRLHPGVSLLGYSFKTTDAVLRGALDAGFSGCIAKDVTLRQLTIALAAVLDGGLYFDQSFGNYLRPALSEKSDTDGLSDREKEVLTGFARGLSAKQISRNLNISDKTVDTYKYRACKKLGLNNRAELVEYVFEQGWITAD